MPSLVSGGTFTNNWKNILDKLESILRTEFKGALPVYTGDKAPAGSTYLQLNKLELSERVIAILSCIRASIRETVRRI